MNAPKLPRTAPTIAQSHRCHPGNADSRPEQLPSPSPALQAPDEPQESVTAAPQPKRLAMPAQRIGLPLPYPAITLPVEGPYWTGSDVTTAPARRSPHRSTRRPTRTLDLLADAPTPRTPTRLTSARR